MDPIASCIEIDLLGDRQFPHVPLQVFRMSDKYSSCFYCHLTNIALPVSLRQYNNARFKINSLRKFNAIVQFYPFQRILITLSIRCYFDIFFDNILKYSFKPKPILFIFWKAIVAASAV